MLIYNHHFKKINYTNFKKLVFFVFAFFLSFFYLQKSYAQAVNTETNGNQSSSIYTAVPFLLIVPDARASAMGDVGAAISGDVNSISTNPSKLAFLRNSSGFGISYSPWLKSLIPDVNLAYLSGHYRLDEISMLGASLRYLSLGKVETYDNYGGATGVYNPNEFAFDVTLARRFGTEFSLAITGRYIHSNLGSAQIGSAQNKPGSAIAADLSGFYKKEAVLFGTDAIIGAGVNISNIGTKMSFYNGRGDNFLPANLKIGGSSTFILDDFSEVTIGLDFNKLLVPTQPIYDASGNIIAGRDPNRSVPDVIFSSFGDAPGGFKEELKEINIATGVEYWYNKQFAGRIGYFYESPDKGNRRYLTLGAGLKYNLMNIDVSYIAASVQKSPLANTLRVSLSFNFGETAGNSAQYK